MQLGKQSPIKEHGKLLSLVHKDYHRLETDYSQRGQKSPETKINTICSAPNGLIIPESGEEG